MLGIRTGLPIDSAGAKSAFEKLGILRQAFREIDFQRKPTILPDRDLDDIHFDGTAPAFNRLASFVRKTMEIEEHVGTLFLNQEEAKARKAGLSVLREGHWEGRGAAGVYYHRGAANIVEPSIIAIDLERFAGASPASLVAVLAHEHAHHALSSRKGIDPGDEELADFLPVLAGFGIFSANSAFSYETEGRQVGLMAWHSWRASTLGYVREEVLTFAQALVTLWRGEPPKPIQSNLKPSVAGYFSRTLRFLQSNRLNYWGIATSKGVSEELETWLSRTGDRTATKSSPTTPKIRRIDVKWSGTFVGIAIRVEDSSGACYKPEAIDFGQLTERIPWKSDTCFGIAYRISSDVPGCSFEIKELLFKEKSTQSTEPKTPSLVHDREVVSGDLVYFLSIANDPLFDSAGEWTFELRHAEASLLRRTFKLYS